MQGGAEASIIAQWKKLAEAEHDVCLRADYAGLALVFAELTDCRPAWKSALEGWNVEVSQQVLEWQAEAEKRGLRRGKAEAILRILQQRFPPAVATDLKQLIRQTMDLERLDQWLDQAVNADSLSDFRRLAGLAARRRPRHRTNGSSGN
jgi:hypothetical protein